MCEAGVGDKPEVVAAHTQPNDKVGKRFMNRLLRHTLFSATQPAWNSSLRSRVTDSTRPRERSISMQRQ